ncbi:MAG TPA: ATP-binding protein [Nostocaceae cyanobacterium]|nr:ATP-binding protein [Nostocaceae cyanobacterium]
MNQSHNSSSKSPLPRVLSVVETWGLGLAGPLGWIGLVASIHNALGSMAIFVWIPATMIGVIIGYQVQYLGKQMTDVAGGTPNYITRLLYRYPLISRYAAIGYVLVWLSALTMSSVIIADLIHAQLLLFSIDSPISLLRVGFVLLPFVVAFSGTRALSILHLFFVLPAIGLLLVFSIHGLGWLIFSPNSPGFFPTNWSWSSLSWVDWMKWFYFATFATYSPETATSFVADSRHPLQTLRCVKFASWLGVPIFLGGSWIVSRLAVDSLLGEDTFLHLLAAAQPFWGEWASLIVIFLLASSALLLEATAVSNCSRILYQLALDRHIAPVFAVVSSRGIFGPCLSLMLLISLVYLLWGNVAQIVVAGNVGWFINYTVLHLGLWLQRGQPGILWPRLSLGIFLLEIVILLVGGFAWGWQDFGIGLLLPFVVLAIDTLIRRLPIAVFRPKWWQKKYQYSSRERFQDSLMFQVTILILLMCGAVLIGWWCRSLLNKDVTQDGHILLIMVLVVVFVGVAIACWTTLPQVTALEEARERAENLNQVLELRVEQRTSELTQVISQLEQEIQERKQTQLALQKAKEAADVANRAKSEFFSKMSHELRTPLNAILGFSQILHRDATLNLEQQKYLGIINRSGEHLLTLINDVLEMSKIEAGKIELQITSFDLYGLLNTIEEMFQLKAQSKGLELIFDCAAQVPQYIVTDDIKLRQVLINLIGNAIKFTESGVVKVSITQKDDQELCFAVEDTGPGIASSELSNLFLPFSQTETGRNSQSGTGLGLTISRQFVQLMGGDIAVSSVLGQGSIFRFNIQIIPTNIQAISTPKPTRKVIGLAPNQPTYRILIVEDKWENRFLLQNLLAPLGFEVREAINGLEAVNLLDTWLPDLIWMDIQMPIMDGYEATQRIRKKFPSAPPFIIALTASAFKEDRSQILAAGCEDAVNKPFREETIWLKMAEYLGVQYIYEQPTPEESGQFSPLPQDSNQSIARDLANIPTELLTQICQAATQLDDELVLQLIEPISQINPAVAQFLTNLVQTFRFDQIVNLIEKYKNESVR